MFGNSVLSAQFWYKPKTALKYKVQKRRRRRNKKRKKKTKDNVNKKISRERKKTLMQKNFK